ncbi:MAG: dihydropteroate synthase [bacterium]
MNAGAGTVSQGADLVFGRDALALGARACGTEGARVRIAFQSGQRAAVAECSAAWESAQIEEHAWESLLSIDLEDLEGLARTTTVGAQLLAAHSAWAAPVPEPEIMGVVNVTPDSFSDGGLFLEPEQAIEHGLQLAAEGAAWLDVGGESTRPGAPEVSVDEELRRVLGVVEALANAQPAQVSIDTRKAEVARAALDRGARMVNDVGAGLDDPEMLALLAERGADYCLMHRQGSIGEMQEDPRYGDPVAEVTEFLRQRVAACLAAGIKLERLYLDPGIGFGKTLDHNLELLRRLGELRSLGLPLLLGVSRKSFIGDLRAAPQRPAGHNRPPSSRLGGTAAAISFCVSGGARVLRVHDVAVMAEAASVARALKLPPAPRPKRPA